MTKLFKNEYIIRKAKGGHVPPVRPHPRSAFVLYYRKRINVDLKPQHFRRSFYDGVPGLAFLQITPT